MEVAKSLLFHWFYKHLVSMEVPWRSHEGSMKVHEGPMKGLVSLGSRSDDFLMTFG